MSRFLHRYLAKHLAAWLLALGSIPALAQPADAYEVDLSNLVSPAYSASLRLVFWVRDGVSAVHETQLINEIVRGAELWGQVPTACVAFVPWRIVHGATQPGTSAGELLVIISDRNDPTVTSGGTSFPSGGNPGTWFSASTVLLDSSIWPDGNHAASVAAHELGHAIGLRHSSISVPYASADELGVMHWAQPPFRLSADDVAGVSVAYPCSSPQLSSTTGSVTGRLLTQSGTPISGINAVAYNLDTQSPTAARITGQFDDQEDGVYRIQGLPPGRYRVDFLDSHYYQGTRSDSGSLGRDYDYQCDNMEYFSSREFRIRPGGAVSLPDSIINIPAMSFDSLGTSGSLPAAGLDLPYDFQARLLGGLRGINSSVSIVPATNGLTAELIESSYDASEPLGALALRVIGTPTALGHSEVRVRLVDREGIEKNFAFGLDVQAPVAQSVLFPALPDLVIDGYDVTPQRPTTLDPISIRLVVKNQGTGNSLASKAAIRFGGETLPIVFDVPMLAPGQNVLLQRSLRPVRGRAYTVVLSANYGSAAIPESDTTNNERSFTTQVVDLADLVVDGASVRESDQPLLGNVLFTVVVRNRGQVASPVSRAAITTDGSTTTFFTAFPVAPGAPATYQRYATLSPGSHSNLITVDFDNKVAEANELNNEMIQSFSVSR